MHLLPYPFWLHCQESQTKYCFSSVDAFCHVAYAILSGILDILSSAYSITSLLPPVLSGNPIPPLEALFTSGSPLAAQNFPVDNSVFKSIEYPPKLPYDILALMLATDEVLVVFSVKVTFAKLYEIPNAIPIDNSKVIKINNIIFIVFFIFLLTLTSSFYFLSFYNIFCYRI